MSKTNTDNTASFLADLALELEDSQSKPVKIVRNVILSAWAVGFVSAFCLSGGIWGMPIFMGMLGTGAGIWALSHAKGLLKDSTLEKAERSDGSVQPKVAALAAVLYAVVPLTLGLWAGKSMLDVETARVDREKAEATAPRETVTLKCSLSAQERKELTRAFEEAKQARAENPANPKRILISAPLYGCTESARLK